MKVAIIYNKDFTHVINSFGIQNKEIYNPETVTLVAESLEKGGHNVRIIDGNMGVIESLQEFMPRVMEGERMGMVFNMAYGIQGESRYTHLPSMLEMLGIPYVGSNPEGHALALDKVITKIVMQKYDIPTPAFWVFSHAHEDISDVVYPVIVKPKMEAVSYGLQVVNSDDDLRAAIDFIIKEFNQQALVEQFIRGREFCVGLLGNGDPEAFPILEIDLNNDPDAFQTVEHKKINPVGKICPAGISGKLAEKMIRLSKNAFNRLGLRDFARVDIRLDQDDNIFLLEINSMASLGLTGSYVHAASVAGYDYEKLVNRMLDVAAVRYFSHDMSGTEETSPSKKEKTAMLPVRIRSFLRTRQEKMEKHLAEMVKINSHVRNIDGVNKLGLYMARQLSHLGFTLQVIPQVEVGNILLFSNSPGSDCDVLILGHLDNPVTFTRHSPYRETAPRLYGTGIWENKGGLVVLLMALHALRFIRALKSLKTGILLITDNALQGKFSQGYIRDISRRAAAVAGLSGSSMESTVITSRSGASVYNCQMNLMDAVTSGDVPAAASKFARLIASITDLTDEEEGIVITPRNVDIKTDIADIYAHGEVSFSVRFNQSEQAEQIDRQIRQIIRKNNTRKGYFQIEGGMRRPPMMRTEDTGAFFALARKIASDLDIRILEEHRWSSSDISTIERGKMMLDGLGPVGASLHDNTEFILRHSLQERGTLLALLLLEIKKVLSS